MQGVVPSSNAPVEEVPSAVLAPSQVCMTFKGVISGATATIGLDSYAQGMGFIHPAFVQQHQLATVPITRVQVLLGDGNAESSATSACRVHIKLGSFTCMAWLLVMAIPSNLNVLLGDAFLRGQGARLEYDRKALVISSKTRQHIIYTIEAQADKAYNKAPQPGMSQSSTPVLLNAIQLKRLFRQDKGKGLVLCVVQQEGLISELPIHEPLSPKDKHDLSNLSPAVADLIRKYPDVFPVKLSLPELRRDMPELIPLQPGAKPTNMPMFRYSPAEDEEIKKQIQLLLEQDLINPSTSPYGAPVLLVPKPDGTWRMCIDYRALNKITVKNSYPLPRIDDLLDKLQGAKFFSALDLMAGYHQLRLRESDIPKTAFKTTAGLFEYKVMTFGFTNAPSVFQQVMNKVFSTAGILNHFVLVYMDDILIFSKSESEHIEHLETVFQVLQKEKLIAKFSKCQFFLPSLKYLGHIISAEGVGVDPAKITSVQQWPLPKTLTELRGFLGLCNYFRKFIPKYSEIALPLTDLTKKEGGQSVLLNPEAINAFQTLKQKLSTAPLLASPDFSKPFRAVVDASQVGIGGVLLQEGKPVAYESRKLIPAELNYSATDRELLAVVHCLKKWRPYMLSHKDNELVTDHKPNVSFETKSTLAPRQVGWIEFLQQFPIKWVYTKGADNIADPLSRLNTFYLNVMQVVETTVDTPPLPLHQLLDSIRAGYKSDPVFACDCENCVKFECVDGLYFYKDRIYVPDTGTLRHSIIQDCHAGLFGGHMGFHKTTDLVSRWFYWPNLQSQVAAAVQRCHVCQLSKSTSTGNQGLLHPLPVPPRPWWSISIDFITGLPLTVRGFDAILTITDRLTRLVHLVPCQTTIDAVDFAQLFLTHVISKHGVPADIVSDRGSIFTGKFWAAVCSALSMHLSKSTAYHPQSDGATEIVNKLVEQVLRCHCMGHVAKWDDYLPMVEFAINNSHHASVKNTPFFLTYGMHPATPVMVDTLKLSKVPAAAAWTSDLADVLQKAKANLQAAKDRQKSYADSKRTEIIFKVGDKVLLSTANLNLNLKTHRKLMPRWVGPFTVVKVLSDVAYTLDLPAPYVQAKIHPTFHVSLLKPYKSDGTVHPPLPLIVDGEVEYEVEDILQVRTHTTNQRTKKDGSLTKGRESKEYLIKWKGYGYEHCTWEPEANLTHCQELLEAFWQHQALLQQAKEALSKGKRATPASEAAATGAGVARTPHKKPRAK